MTTDPAGSDRARPYIYGLTLGAHEALARLIQAHPADHATVFDLARTEARHRQKWRVDLYRLILTEDVWVAAAARLTPEQLEALQTPAIVETPYAAHEGEDAGHILPAG